LLAIRPPTTAGTAAAGTAAAEATATGPAAASEAAAGSASVAGSATVAGSTTAAKTAATAAETTTGAARGVRIRILVAAAIPPLALGIALTGSSARASSGIHLLEQCPPPLIRGVIQGLELRFLSVFELEVILHSRVHREGE
jgi:hypothetical protein